MLLIQSKKQIMIKKIRKKYFTTSGYSKFTSNTLDAKIIQKNLVNESD